jgi:glycosyltransferase involved in cell wall biosynthesis
VKYDAVFYTPLIGPLLAPTQDPPPGGAETQIYLLARELAAQGLRICVVSYQTTEGLPASVDGFDVRARPGLRWATVPGVRGRLLEIWTIIRTLWPLRSRNFVQRGTTIETGIVGFVARLRRARFIYSSANTVDFTWNEVASRPNVALFQLGVRLANEIVVQSHEQAELCRCHWRRPSVVIKSVAEQADQRQGSPGFFLWIGKLTPYKRPLAFAELARAVPEASFKMICVGTEKQSAEIGAELAAAAAGLGNLELLDARPRSEVSRLIEQCVAVVSTSEYEGMPNVFLEAWARGVPTLTLLHDPDDVISSHGLGAVAGDSADNLAELTREFWGTREDQQEIAARCRSYIDADHSAQRVAARWIDVLNG